MLHFKLFILKKSQKFNHLCDWQVTYPPLDAYADNLAQIDPNHAIHGIIPETKRYIRVFSFNI